MRQTLTRTKNFLDIYFLTIISCIFFLLRLPSVFEPYWYGDEGVYQVIGMALNHGRLLYQGIWDNKPPMLYLVYAFFQSDQATIKLFSLFTGVLSVVLFYKLSQKLFQRRTMTIVSTSFFAILFGTPLLEGNIANAENFIIPLTLIAANIAVGLNLSNKVQKKMHAIMRNKLIMLNVIGLSLGIAFLFKAVAIFDLAAFTLFIIYIQPKQKSLKQCLQNLLWKILPIGISFFIPLFITMLFFAFHHTLPDFIQSAFLSNVGYVNYSNQFIIPQGLLIIKLLILTIYLLILFIKRNNLPKEYLFVYLWLGFSLFNALFSQKPYTHYLLVLLASFSLFITITLFEKQGRIIIGCLFVVFSIIIAKNFYVYEKNIAYYQNFLSMTTNHESLNSYRGFFDPTTITNYDLAQYINTHSKATDNIFLWGNNGQVYKLVNKLPPGKFIVAYHITWTNMNISQTVKDIQKANPKYIIIMPDTGLLPISLKEYRQAITIQEATIYTHI